MAKESKRGGEEEEEDVGEERVAGWGRCGMGVWVKGCGEGPLRGIRAGGEALGKVSINYGIIYNL